LAPLFTGCLFARSASAVERHDRERVPVQRHDSTEAPLVEAEYARRATALSGHDEGTVGEPDAKVGVPFLEVDDGGVVLAFQASPLSLPSDA
jgi:hypothetical protein